MKASVSDQAIVDAIDGGRLPGADTRIAFRIMQAAERQAAALETIALLLTKLAHPPMMTRAPSDEEVEAFKALKPGSFVVDPPMTGESLHEVHEPAPAHVADTPLRRRRGAKVEASELD